MSKLVFFCKPYRYLIFKVEGIIRNNLVWDSISIKNVDPDEISNLFFSHFS